MNAADPYDGVVDSPGSEVALELLEERAAISRRTIQGQSVRVATTTTLHDHTIEEPLARETIEIERVAIGRIVDTDPEVRQEGDVTILPVMEEVLVLERRLVLKEEVRIRRVRSTQLHRETVQLREQVATALRLDAEAGAESHQAQPTQPTTQERETMTDQTIVAVYDTPAHAELAVQDLLEAGIPESAIHRHAQEGSYAGRGTIATARTTEGGGFWSNLFGGEHEHDTTVYDRSVSEGANAVSVKVGEDHVVRVTDILERHDPVDMDERAGTYGLTETTTTRTPLAGTVARDTTSHDGGVIELAEEALAVGKRVINQGTTRIRRFVVETPVEENVSLRDERVTIERRPVTDGRPVSDSFTDKTIEMTESREEAVVSKTAHVKEEINLRKEATDRVETVRDTLRREDVEIVKVPGDKTVSATVDTKTRTPAI